MNYIVLLGRILFALIFITSGFSHFKAQTIQHAASHGVIMPNFLVPASGVLAILGALSIILGYHTKIGALMIIAFLVPVTLTMHNFWTLSNPQERMIQSIMFMKNISMLGGALLILYFGAGPMSLDNRSEMP
jgi:putative oxidoreductase